jgi:hypothetical protein
MSELGIGWILFITLTVLVVCVSVGWLVMMLDYHNRPKGDKRRKGDLDE